HGISSQPLTPLRNDVSSTSRASKIEWTTERCSSAAIRTTSRQACKSVHPLAFAISTNGSKTPMHQWNAQPYRACAEPQLFSPKILRTKALVSFRASYPAGSSPKSPAHHSIRGRFAKPYSKRKHALVQKHQQAVGGSRAFFPSKPN